MMDKPICPICGANTDDCEADFHQMLYWEAERPDFAMRVHHLMVLGYYMQHPQRYSPETLQASIQMLKQFLVDKMSPQTMGKHLAEGVDSGKRKHKITGTAQHFGKYEPQPRWTMHAAEVVSAGLENYCESVEAWANSIYEDLKIAGFYEG